MTPGAVASTDPALPPDARAAIADHAASTPDWRPWLGMLETVLGEADHAAWRASEIRFPVARPADAPLLEGAHIVVEATAADRALTALAGIAGLRPAAGLDAAILLEAAVAHDLASVVRLAEVAGLEPGTLTAVAHHLTLPLLLEAGRRAAPMIPGDWRRGYCPVCGAWPILGELRGLERQRALCCGRCGTGWSRDVLHCAFCGERDHRRQGALVPDDDGERLRIDTCRSCQGYLKVVTTLRPRPVWELHLTDLATLPLELAARDRGFARPEGSGWHPQTVITAVDRRA